MSKKTASVVALIESLHGAPRPNVEEHEQLVALLFDAQYEDILTEFLIDDAFDASASTNIKYTAFVSEIVRTSKHQSTRGRCVSARAF